MAFKKGVPRPPNSGRKVGAVNKQTALVRAGVESAIETCRNGGMTPVQIMMESARFIRGVAAMKTPAQKEMMANMPRDDLEFIVDMLVKASDIAAKAAEFAFPKLARVDYVGDVPNASTVENKMIFILNIGEGQPGRPVIDGTRSD
jgi:hypothetical protein